MTTQFEQEIHQDLVILMELVIMMKLGNGLIVDNDLKWIAQNEESYELGKKHEPFDEQERSN